MGRYIILAILLYGFFILIYLHRERRKRKAKKSTFNLFKAALKEDIIGKSKFNIRQLRTEAPTLIDNEKGVENASIFADENKQNTSAKIPSEELDAVFSNHNSTDAEDEDSTTEINVEIENVPPELEAEEELDDLDEEETEEEDTEGAAGVSIALGLGFDDLAGMLHTVNNDKEATAEKREEAGRVLLEMRQTDMFEQIVSGEPKKEAVVSTLMDEYFAAFHRKKQEAGVLSEPTVKAPKDFDIRSFA